MDGPADPPTDWLTPAQAGPLLCGVAARTVRNLMSVGTRTPRGVIRLRCQPCGGQKFTRRVWVAEYLEAVRAAFAPADTESAATPQESATEQAERFAREQAEAAAKFDRRRPTTRARS
jgi:hypothetical protein